MKIAAFSLVLASSIPSLALAAPLTVLPGEIVEIKTPTTIDGVSVNDGEIRNSSYFANDGSFTNRGRLINQDDSVLRNDSVSSNSGILENRGNYYTHLTRNEVGGTIKNYGYHNSFGGTDNYGTYENFGNYTFTSVTTNSGIYVNHGLTYLNGGHFISSGNIQSDGQIGIGHGRLNITSEGTVDGSGEIVSDGVLQVNGQLSQRSIEITGNGVLQGIGTVDSEVVMNGGALSPGDGGGMQNFGARLDGNVGNLTINGDMTIESDAVFFLDFALGNIGVVSDVVSLNGNLDFWNNSGLWFVFPDPDEIKFKAGDVFDFLVADQISFLGNPKNTYYVFLNSGYGVKWRVSVFQGRSDGKETLRLAALPPTAVPVPGAFLGALSAFALIPIVSRSRTGKSKL